MEDQRLRGAAMEKGGFKEVLGPSPVFHGGPSRSLGLVLLSLTLVGSIRGAGRVWTSLHSAGTRSRVFDTKDALEMTLV